MLRKILSIAGLIAAAMLLSGCPGLLTSSLNSDLVISLGRFRPEENGGLVSAVGGEMHIPVQISDLSGNEVTGPFDVSFTLSGDADLSTDGDNIDAGSASITDGTVQNVSLDVPAAVVAGGYTLFASFSAAEGDPAVEIGDELLNIGSVGINFLATNEADLEIQFVDPQSIFRNAGSTFNLSYRVSNTGGKAISSGTDILTDFEIDIDGTPTEFGSNTITLENDLFPTDYVTATAEISMPTLTQMAADASVDEADLTIWNGTLTGTIDPDDSIPEIAEGGTDTFSVSSGNRKPELSVSSIDLPDTAKVGGPVEFAVTITNSGTSLAAAGSYGLLLFHDVNSNADYDVGTDTEIDTISSTAAVPYDLTGGNDEVIYFASDFSVENYPASITEGGQEIGVVITGDLDEYNTGNNSSSASITFIDSLVDLEILRITSSLSSFIDEGTGGTIPLDLKIINSGEETVTTDFDIEFFASDDGFLNVADTNLGTIEITEDIAAGEILDVPFDGSFPAGEGAGFYTVFAFVDRNAEVAETDEDNNLPDDPDETPVYVVVDDGATSLNANVLVKNPESVSGTNYHTIYFYDSVWTLTNSSSEWQYSPLESDSMAITLTPGQDHGLRFRNNYRNLALAFRLVPDYVFDVANYTMISVPLRDDGFGDNTSTASAVDLSGTNNPFFGLVGIYESEDDEDNYFTFSF
ncbi:CARDB domain-containing protein [Salinispira pacifica]|uniref:CARDB domain-containing protein n=1 Tax=Salinispira pacifica TaxID=1307761 RepID=V5WLU2_9SPIO|nr:CARDB domain-containing protein [Salinispira pacifica]AHC16598.1 hypothetical protein L21SP2_3258 [Salinispira pacifica]